jgi:hypothetical protein
MLTPPALLSLESLWWGVVTALGDTGIEELAAYSDEVADWP